MTPGGRAAAAAAPRFAALVLAAGASRRMGREKALLRTARAAAAESALARILRVVTEAGACQRVLVLNAALANRLEPLPGGATCAVNPDPSRGRSSSLKIGLMNLAPGLDAFLLCPVDVPLFERADVLRLADAFRDRAPGIEIVLPVAGGRRGHPALFACSLIGEFLALGDDQPARDLVRLKPERVLEVPLDNLELVRDWNTTADHEAALLRREGGPPAGRS